MGIKLVGFSAIFAKRLPPKIPTVHFVPDTKHLLFTDAVQRHRQLKQLTKPLAQIRLTALGVHTIAFANKAH
jgi:hypothetical protein